LTLTELISLTLYGSPAAAVRQCHPHFCYCYTYLTFIKILFERFCTYACLRAFLPRGSPFSRRATPSPFRC